LEAGIGDGRFRIARERSPKRLVGKVAFDQICDGIVTQSG